MTSPASIANAWRLPRDFALITVAVEAAIVGVHFGRQLWPGSGHEGYGLDVWAGMAANLAMSWVLAAALAWSHARQALEVRGGARLAQLRGPRVRHAGAYLIVRVLDYFVLSPWLYGLGLLYMPGGRLVQLAMLVLSVWLATWLALRQGTQASAASFDAGDADAVAPASASPGRATVALLIAAVSASIQIWCAMVTDPWHEAMRTMDRVAPFLSWVAPPLLVFALAFWGAWLGIGRGPLPHGSGPSGPWPRRCWPLCWCWRAALQSSSRDWGCWSRPRPAWPVSATWSSCWPRSYRSTPY